MTKFGKITIFGIVIVVLMVAGFSVWFFNSDRKANNIERAITEAQYCEVKSDCVQVESKCPFGCYTFVNKKEADRIQTLIDTYESRCAYLCLELKGYDCVNNKCKALYSNEGINRAELLENCTKDVSKRVDDTAFDSENKIVTIYLWDEESQDSIPLKLLYEPETDFAGCSDSAKDILRHIQELDEEGKIEFKAEEEEIELLE